MGGVQTSAHYKHIHYFVLFNAALNGRYVYGTSVQLIFPALLKHTYFAKEYCYSCQEDFKWKEKNVKMHYITTHINTKTHIIIHTSEHK